MQKIKKINSNKLDVTKSGINQFKMVVAALKKVLSNVAFSYDDFVKKTGMLNDNKEIKKLSLSKRLLSKLQDGGAFAADSETYQLLLDFVAENPEYHIITEVEGDEEENLEDQVFILCNEPRFVNRLRYYLGKGSKRPLFFRD